MSERDERAGLSEAEWRDVLATLPESPEDALGWELSLVRRTVERILHDHIAAAIARAEAAEARVAAVTKVHGEYFDLDREPFDDASPEPEDVWRFDRDLRAALTTPTTDQPASAGGA